MEAVKCKYIQSLTEPCSENLNEGCDAALIVKLKNTHTSIFRDTGLFAQQYLIAITCLYLCTDKQKVLQYLLAHLSRQVHKVSL